MVERYVYDVFGAVNVYDGSGTPLDESAYGNPYMFTGRRYDDETGLYYYRARMYAPDLGRFLQPDPIGYDDGMNMYTYVGNNPTSFVDPFGLCKGDRGFLRKLWDGDYFGTQYGASSTDIWAARAVASKTWYGTAGNYVLGGFSALWTPATYKETAMVLAIGYAAGRSVATQGSRGLVQNKMYKDALQPYKNGPLTNAGRALTKHPNIIGADDIKMLNQVAKSAASKNRAAAEALKNIMRNGTKAIKNTNVYGKVVEYKLPNGLGVRFNAITNEFIGFLGRGL
ncbi:MAG TPA: RHS repeat-associated core domain-containing protein [Anaerohalosphaeraceae bacterium]|nr:RHS repeat-associated core domain-containing protein [Anaerohalosphaeraceae bacterium]HRT86686.1 RHS repeat-associated core domain-containing protein [Anaerohalosphaeraceae bacterium]